jgi:CheY-like chemotaxis protein
MTPLSIEVSTWRVLAVDDEPDNLDLLVEVLGFTGVTITSAETGQQAIEKAASFQPNIILTDLAMPGMSGWELQKHFRQQRELDAVPIIAVTALAMPDEVEKVATARFDGYIVKPFRSKELLVEMEKCIRTFLQSS